MQSGEKGVGVGVGVGVSAGVVGAGVGAHAVVGGSSDSAYGIRTQNPYAPYGQFYRGARQWPDGRSVQYMGAGHRSVRRWGRTPVSEAASCAVRDPTVHRSTTVSQFYRGKFSGRNLTAKQFLGQI